MTSFDRNAAKTLRTELETALATVATKHGVNLSLGTIRFSPDNLRVRLTATPRFPKLTTVSSFNLPTDFSTGKPAITSPTKPGSDPYNTTESREYLQAALSLGLPANGLGRKFRSGSGRIFTVTGLNTRRWKMPVSGTGSQGGRYKFTAAQVLKGLI